MRCIAVLCFASLAFAAGTQPKPKPEDYEVSAKGKDFRIGAEYMVHSFSGNGKMYIIENYLVVEVALYPPEKSDAEVKADPGAFRLRVDGKKPILSPDPPATAAVAFRKQGSVLGKVLGGVAPVLLGGAGGSRMPGPQPAPNPNPPGGIPQAEPDDASELLQSVAFPTGTFEGPVAGFLYFAYRGKPGKIETLELLYGDALIKLR